MLKHLPRTYKPHKGAPLERAGFATPAEWKMLAAMTDGKLDMTKYGVPSAFMETSGGFKGGTTGIGTKSGGGSTAGKTSSGGGNTGPQNQNNPGGSGPRAGNSNSGNSNTGNGGGFGSMAGAGNTPGTRAAGGAGNQTKSGFGSGINTPNASGSPVNNPTGISNSSSRAIGNAIGNALGRSLGGISTPSASGSPVNNPASINVTPGNGSLQNAMIQRQAVNAMAPMAGERVTDVFGPNYPQDPSIAGRVQAKSTKVPAGERVSAVFGPAYPQDPSIAGRLNTPQPANVVQQSMTPEQQAARIAAISRGPGSVAGVMPGASSLSQQRTLQTLSGAMTDGGVPMSAKDAQNLARTIAGESIGEPAFGQTAVANTMLNRMALAAQGKAKYMGGANIDKLMGQYDATGMRPGTTPNSTFTNAKLGTDALGKGIASLAGAASPVSQFNTTAPQSVKEATSFYNPKTSDPVWGGPQFTKVGNHVFGLPTELAGKGSIVTAARGMPASQPAQPTQVASISPAMGPPTPQQKQQATPVAPATQQQPSVPGPSLWQQYAPNALQAAVAKAPEAYDAFTAANQKINSVPGGASTVTAIAKLLQGGGKATPPKSGTGGGGFKIGDTSGGVAAKVVAGPTTPQPGFTWVQWTPGQPPVQVPNTALASNSGKHGLARLPKAGAA